MLPLIIRTEQLNGKYLRLKTQRRGESFYMEEGHKELKGRLYTLLLGSFVKLMTL